MNAYKCEVWFRIYHPKIDLGKVADQLGLVVKTKWVAGSPRKTPKGRLLSGVYESSYCLFLLSPDRDMGLVEFLDSFARRLETHKGILSSLCKTGGKLEIYISMFVTKNSGEVFGWNVLARLSKLKISLALDIYPK
jgi:hypothetical protein